MLHVVQQRSIWGEFGHELVRGHAARYYLSDEPMIIHRVGQFVPPLHESGARLIVSDSVKRAIERDRPFPTRFRATTYGLVTRLDWHLWDFSAEWPAWVPSTNDPDDYWAETSAPLWLPWRVRAWWSKRLARTMEPSWELLLPVIKCNVELDGIRSREYVADLFGYDYTGLFYSSDRQVWPLACAAAKTWLASTLGPWIDFQPVRIR